MEIDFTRVWNWYSRESVQNALIFSGKGREVASIYRDGNFGNRPNIINYPGDILQAVAEGTVSFHGSVELWSNPMKLEPNMQKDELDNLRNGWDILIDPDVPDFEISKITVKNVIEALKDHGIKSYSIKFSGGKGFHIGIPFNSIPNKINLKPSNKMYPELLQKIIEFLKDYIKDSLKESILSLGPLEVISQKINIPKNKITNEKGLDPFKVVNMDIFSSRHLFRLPYSLHEKSLLVSLPLKYEKLEKFEKEMAKPEKVKVDENFLKKEDTSHDAEALIIQSLDWANKNKIEIKETISKRPKHKNTKTKYISENLFPPCIKNMLNNGLSDGKKRGIFVLINFLRNMGWTQEQIEKRIFEWNEKNIPQIRRNYLLGQLRWHFRNEKSLLPPNCLNENYYKSFGCYECCNNLHQSGIKNPVSYPFRILKSKSNLKKRRKIIRNK